MKSQRGFGGWILLVLIIVVVGLPLFPINRAILQVEDPVARANWIMLEMAAVVLVAAAIQGQFKADALAKRGIGEVVGFCLAFSFLAGLIVYIGINITAAILSTASETFPETNPFLLQIVIYFIAYNAGYWPSRYIKQRLLGIKPETNS